MFKADAYDWALSALLSLAEKPSDSPFVAEKTLKLKIEADRRNEARLPRPSESESSRYLLAREWSCAMLGAKLTQRQTVVVSMRLDGRTFEEIGARCGHTKQAAQRIFIQGAKKLALAYRNYPYRGLSEVYRTELKRGRNGSTGTIKR